MAFGHSLATRQSGIPDPSDSRFHSPNLRCIRVSLLQT